ncbi:MAG: SUMF1/EgtB/PvdO family nonheme iron enzyme [Bacteroidetes bacterium]|nr:SUMF1/EgtB/PvdO family nonheme iron enzyme [Bacteroidota bacterium]
MKTYLILIGLIIPIIAYSQVKENNEFEEMVKIGNIYVDKYEAPNIAGEVPFVMFNYIEADCWCQARGKRLLFDDEWVLVAGGPLSLPYVYGTTYNSLVCNDNKVWIAYNQSLLNLWPTISSLNNINTFSELIDSVINISAGASLSADHVLYLYQADTAGSDTSCVSYYGVYDMNGNVSEWTCRRDGGNPGFHGNLKGGYWAQSRTIQASTTSHGDAFRFYQTGFRCAKDFVCINTTDTITVSNCDSYTAPDGTVYTTSGIKTAVIPNAAGCDSTIIIDLIVSSLPPEGAGSITGDTSIYQQRDSITYSIPIIPFASSYIWNFPAGVIGNSNTNSITVDFGSFYDTCTISVYGHNGCGDGLSSFLYVNARSGSSVLGTLTYANSLSTPLNNSLVSLELNGTTVMQTTTNSNGYFEFNNIENGSYTLNALTTKLWGGVNAIDALLIMKHFVGISTLQGLKLQVADLDGSSFVNASDALLVMRRFVGLTNSFSVGDWGFENPEVTRETQSVITQNIKGLCYGDVDCSYVPAARIEPSLVLSNQGSLLVELGTGIQIPVKSIKEYQLSSMSFVLQFNPYETDVINIVPDGLLCDNLESLFISNIVNDEIRIGWYSLTPVNIKPDETLFSINARIKKENSPVFVVTEESNLSDDHAQIIPDAEISIPKLVYISDGFIFNCCVPNPINLTAEISFTLPADGNMKVYLYDALGEQVDLVLDKSIIRGTYDFIFNAGKYSNGIYWLKADFKGAGKHWMKTVKVVVVK